jgi:hypothetical protein
LTDRRGYLAIYLDDHLAGSTTAVELLRRAGGEHEDVERHRLEAGSGAITPARAP